MHIVYAVKENGYSTCIRLHYIVKVKKLKSSLKIKCLLKPNREDNAKHFYTE